MGLFLFWYFCYIIDCNKMKDGILKEEEERYMHQLHKSYL